jgi:membrane-associated phospholipid phosphatase
MYRRLLFTSLLALLGGAVLVAVCYFFVDQPVARAMHDRDHSYDTLLREVTYVPPRLQAWVPVLLVVFAIRRAWGPLGRWERALVAAGVAVVVADQFKGTLAYVFGRYWPETWIDNNPSLIQDGAYGFHPFQSGSAYTSFPSGHMARTLGFFTVVWIAFPWWRWLCVLGSLAEAVSLVGMNYHFLGDVIGGTVVGGLVGLYAAAVAVPEVFRSDTRSAGAES